MAFYFVNFACDEGRYQMIKPIADKIGGEIIQVDPQIDTDKHGFINDYGEYNWDELSKEIKMKVMGNFLHHHPKEKFLWLFEDNLIPHKEFDSLFEKARKFVNERTPLITYLALENAQPIDEINKLDEHFGIFPYQTNDRCSLATVYRRDVIRMMLTMWRVNKTKQKGHNFDDYYLQSINRAFPKGIVFMDPPLFKKYPPLDIMLPQNVKKIPHDKPIMKIEDGDYEEIANTMQIVCPKPLDQSFLKWVPYIRQSRKIPSGGLSTFILMPTKCILLWNDIKLQDLLAKPGKYPVYSCPRCTKKLEPIDEAFVWVIIDDQFTPEVTDETPLFVSREQCTEISNNPHSISFDDVTNIDEKNRKKVMRDWISKVVGDDASGSTFPRSKIQSLITRAKNTYHGFEINTTPQQALNVTLRIGGVSEMMTWRIVLG